MVNLMRIPTIRGLIDRRVLVNFRVESNALAKILPAPFRPQLVDGFGIAGICLIRLTQIRPKFFPAIVSGSRRRMRPIALPSSGMRPMAFAQASIFPGEILPLCSMRLWVVRLFPGIHHRARFDVRETEDEYHIAMHSLDGSAHVRVDGHTTTQLPDDSIFSTVRRCLRFFRGRIVRVLSQQFRARI